MQKQNFIINIRKYPNAIQNVPCRIESKHEFITTNEVPLKIS